MAGNKIIFGKPKRKLKGTFVYGRPFTGFRIKNECQYSILPDEYQELAAKAYREGTLDLLNGKLRCKCGASVGAKKTDMGNYGPTLHPEYKEPRQPPARKPSPRK